jgi:putative ABC transport system permease protein
VPLLAGRSFAEAYGGDVVVGPTNDQPFGTAAFVVNRAAANRLGWTPEDAVGKWLERDYSEDFSRTVRGQVVGVVEDMRFDSLRDAIKPTFFVLAPGAGGLTDISVRVGDARLSETLGHLDAVWQRTYPGQPINRTFLDFDFQSMYDQETRFIQLLVTFAGFSILLSCMGLFGLTAFAAERRTREIGVRKVMGSSVWGIVRLFTNEVSRQVMLANVLAWPVAYVAMQRWLDNFAYRIDLTPLVFIGSGLIALCIAWVTVGGTAAKAACAKPVLALRYE